jgi:hypothetical protein
VTAYDCSDNKPTVFLRQITRMKKQCALETAGLIQVHQVFAQTVAIDVSQASSPAQASVSFHSSASFN